jgi:hypothetical protein
VALDIGEQITLGLVAGCVSAIVDQFGFEGAEDAFHGCIVPTVSFSAHGRLDIEFDRDLPQGPPAAFRRRDRFLFELVREEPSRFRRDCSPLRSRRELE